MGPSEQAKRVGLKNLTQVSKISGVGLSTLSNWYKFKPDLFRIVLNGCLLELKKNRCNNINKDNIAI